MTYSITKQIRILHEQHDWDFVFELNEYGTVGVSCHEGLDYEDQMDDKPRNTVPASPKRWLRHCTPSLV
jgi:hypothetical protein